jgi:dihydroneopterin aldolase
MVRAWISVNNIICKTIIGIYPDELSILQKVEIGFSFEYNCEQAIAIDSIENAVDYAALTEELKTFVFNSRFSLLETLANEIVQKILAFSQKITAVKVYCIKLNELKPKVEIEANRN